LAEAEQAVVQVPQWLMSVCKFTQAPEQAVVPVAQVVVQAPFEQTWPEVHALPQLPQFAVSEVVSMQVVLPLH
jgi:uncharacterized membrane protein